MPGGIAAISAVSLSLEAAAAVAVSAVAEVEAVVAAVALAVTVVEAAAAMEEIVTAALVEIAATEEDRCEVAGAGIEMVEADDTVPTRLTCSTPSCMLVGLRPSPVASMNKIPSFCVFSS